MSPHENVFRGQDKLAFVLAFVPYLVENSPVTVSAAAAHFDVEPEFVRAVARLIAVSGIPGQTRSYQPEDLFDISWEAFEENDEIVLTQLIAIDDSPRFSAREAAALIAGLHYLSALPENANRSVITQLFAKLSRGASASPSQLTVAPSATNATLELIRQCATDGTQVAFDYVTSRGEQEHRTVDPLLVESVDRDWYLRGWDHGRDATRTFRLDRMSHVTPTRIPVSDRAAEVELSEQLFEPSENNITVDIEVAEAALPFIGEWLCEEPVPGTRKGVLNARLHVAHFHGLKRLVAQHSGMITVMAPTEARSIVESWAREGAAQYPGL